MVISDHKWVSQITRDLTISLHRYLSKGPREACANWHARSVLRLALRNVNIVKCEVETITSPGCHVDYGTWGACGVGEGSNGGRFGTSVSASRDVETLLNQRLHIYAVAAPVRPRDGSGWVWASTVVISDHD